MNCTYVGCSPQEFTKAKEKIVVKCTCGTEIHRSNLDDCTVICECGKIYEIHIALDGAPYTYISLLVDVKLGSVGWEIGCGQCGNMLIGDVLSDTWFKDTCNECDSVYDVTVDVFEEEVATTEVA